MRVAESALPVRIAKRQLAAQIRELATSFCCPAARCLPPTGQGVDRAPLHISHRFPDVDDCKREQAAQGRARARRLRPARGPVREETAVTAAVGGEGYAHTGSANMQGRRAEAERACARTQGA